MLKYRIPMALLISAIFSGCLWFDTVYATSWGISGFLAVGTVIVLREFYTMVEHKGIKPLAVFGMLMGVCLVFAHDRWCWEKWHNYQHSVPDLMSTVLALCVLGTCILQFARKNLDGTIMAIGSTLMGLVYVWFLPGFLLKLRHLGLPNSRGWIYDGTEMILLTVIAAKISDVGAFFTGRALGKTKMCPQISPNKTWEGAVGGFLTSVLTVLLIRYFWSASLLGHLSLFVTVVFALLMAIGSLMGDLFESCMKRDSQVKDSSSLIPGFGGMMDVVDSLMVAAPLSYFFFILVGARPGLSI